MITIRRAHQRECVVQHDRESWISFDRAQPDLRGEDLGPLDGFREGRLPPRASVRSTMDAEIVTYVRSGTLAYEDSTGRAGLIHAGEFQRMTAGTMVRYEETNASPTQWAHVFQVYLRAQAGIEAGHEQRRFSVAERRGVLCMVASQGGERGSLELHQDAQIYSSLLTRGQHVIHGLDDQRCVWLHIVEGSASVGGQTLATGDGARISAEHAVSLTASQDTELLLLDLRLGASLRREDVDHEPRDGSRAISAMGLSGSLWT